MWTPKHQREALRFILKLFEQIAETATIYAGGELSISWSAVTTEAAFRASLRDLKTGLAAASEIDVERAVGRVRDFAEGRRVRILGYRVGADFFAREDRERALARAAEVCLPCYRATRIRKVR